MAALCSGTAVLCPSDGSMEATIACLRDQRATHIMHWPQQLDLMKDNPVFRELLARMRPAYAHQYEFFGLTSPELNANTLGMTETLGPHSMMPIGPLPADKPGSFGLAVGGIERRIVDPETGEALPPGAFGQLCLRGGALMKGMHRKALEDVFDREGFYRTDDIAMIDEDGHLFFSGRGGDIIKISGANVSPVEVEGVIRTLPGIKAVCVVGVPVDDRGDTLVAAVVPEEGAQLDADDLRATLKQRLSSYKVPRHWLFLGEEELPMTATAKIFKPRLKQLLADRLRPLTQK
jgi:acyl-CoA synthetase (AMP-forming)/AMP-acid ligase II